MANNRGIRIGELLVRHGVLSEQQVFEILQEQKRTQRPFGDLAERMFEVSAEAVEQAWIEQYLTLSPVVDLNEQDIDVKVLKVLNRRQAWQFRMLPLRREEDELVIATTQDRLKRAVNFAWRRVHDPVYFLIARRPQLEDFLMQHYPWPAALNLPAAG
jgi:hypothetical protein